MCLFFRGKAQTYYTARVQLFHLFCRSKFRSIKLKFTHLLFIHLLFSSTRDIFSHAHEACRSSAFTGSSRTSSVRGERGEKRLREGGTNRSDISQGANNCYGISSCGATHLAIYT
mmetsp:Transcript_9110/g.17142  ORF Transcript_9110/g.17142 Transcript_9110/m.17142 type:complete len:115 (-) Transcript_9110:222-566(-)